MKVTINANGTTIQAEISEEQLKELGLIEEQPTGYERVKKGEMYDLVDIYNNIMRVTEYNNQDDKQSYNIGNYYSDGKIAENNARADRLMRRLRQWQALHDRTISIKDWEDYTVTKFFIIYNYGEFGRECRVYPTKLIREPNIIYFSTEEKAEEAIKIFKDELEWYFTEYQQRLDEG